MHIQKHRFTYEVQAWNAEGNCSEHLYQCRSAAWSAYRRLLGTLAHGTVQLVVYDAVDCGCFVAVSHTIA